MRGAPKTERVGEMETRSGRIVTSDGRRLHSSRDPVREAARWARGLDITDVSAVVVLGFGSGHHIRAIERRCDAAIIVYEPDVEVLKQGLEHGPLSDRVTLFTTCNPLARYLAAGLRGTDRGIVIPWTPSARASPGAYRAALAAATDAIGRAKLRHRTACLRARGWLAHYMENLGALPKTPTLPRLAGSMEGVPAIIVAAGPSLDRNVEQLADLRERALVLTVNTAAKALAAREIRPHALVSIESADVTAGLRDLPWLEEVPAFVELTGHPRIWELPFESKVAISVDTNACAAFSNRLDAGLGISGGFCVANAAVAIAHSLGCDPIVLVGSDLAYADGRVYASGTMFEEMRAKPSEPGQVSFSGLESRRKIEEASGNALGGNHMPNRMHTIEVPNWSGDGVVVTTRDFAMFRDWYADFARRHPDATLINATEGGAHIEGWQHRQLEDVANAELAVAHSTRPEAKFAQARAVAPAPLAQLRAPLEAEHRRAVAVIEACEAALALIGHDPDGDLEGTPAIAQRLHELNADTRALLRAAPLVAEAAFGPIEELRTRGDISTYSFYASLVGPVRDLARQLAQLLHSQRWQDDLSAPPPPTGGSLSATTAP